MASVGKRIRWRPSVAMGCAVLVCLACALSTDRGAAGYGLRLDPMEIEIVEALETFRERPERRFLVVKKAIGAVAVGTALAVVHERLGPPDRFSWSYTLFYSSVLGLVFDKDRHVTSIDSDMASAARAGGRRKVSDPEVLQASEAFRAGGFNRQQPAAVLLSAIEPGMQDTEIGPLLGQPDAVFWEYDLNPATTATLVIAFDSTRQVTGIDY